MAALAISVAVPVEASEITLDGQTGYAIEATVNGVQLLLRVDPGASGTILLNPQAAARASGHLDTGRAVGLVGPVRLPGKSSEAQVSIGGVTNRARMIWFDRTVVDGADGVIGPHMLPYDGVTFQIGRVAAPEAEMRFPVRFDEERGLFHRFRFAGKILITRFSLRDRLSTATASAGALIAQRNGGAWAGPSSTYPVRFNVVRPVRPMNFGRQLDLNGLSLAALAVRTSDDRGSYRLPTQQSADPDEIVVTGSRPSGKARFSLMLGQDNLSRCSSIRYQRSPRLLVLTCPQRRG